MPQFHSNAADEAGEGLDDFTRAYIEAIYFTETGDTDQPDSEAELTPDARVSCINECRQFQEANAALLQRAYACDAYNGKEWTPQAQAGHDFWLTRNGHGAGFWDRGLPDDIGDALTQAAKDCGERYAFGDAEFIYVE